MGKFNVTVKSGKATLTRKPDPKKEAAEAKASEKAAESVPESQVPRPGDNKPKSQ